MNFLPKLRNNSCLGNHARYGNMSRDRFLWRIEFPTKNTDTTFSYVPYSYAWNKFPLRTTFKRFFPPNRKCNQHKTGQFFIIEPSRINSKTLKYSGPAAVISNTMLTYLISDGKFTADRHFCKKHNFWLLFIKIIKSYFECETNNFLNVEK